MTSASDEGGGPTCWAHLFDDTGDDLSPAWPGPVVVDLGAADTGGPDGVAWSLPHGGDLDANLVRLDPGGAIGEHINSEVDVLVFVQSGSGDLTIDGVHHLLCSDVLALIPRGARRAVSASAQGVTYLSIHRRRVGLTIAPTRPMPGDGPPPSAPAGPAT